MGRAPLVPLALTKRPFTIEEARSAGLDRWHLRGSSWRRIGPETYAWSGLGDAPIVRVVAASLRLPPSALFSGLTAAWLHGLEAAPCDPIAVTVPLSAGVSGRAGMLVHRATLSEREITKRNGLRVTTIERTLADLCVNMDPTEVVVLADAATHHRLTSIKSLAATADRSAGRAGVAVLRRVIGHIEPAAESPMETRLRMLLVLAGLPRPIAQRSIHDRWGRILGRPDLYYPDAKLGLEYDGGTHRTSLVDDNRRQNRLLAEGVRLLRFTAADIYNRPSSVVEEVRSILERPAA
jgi:Protein of unknown function (DUF559)